MRFIRAISGCFGVCNYVDASTFWSPVPVHPYPHHGRRLFPNAKPLSDSVVYAISVLTMVRILGLMQTKVRWVPATVRKSEDMPWGSGLGLGGTFSDTPSDPQTEDPRAGLETCTS